MVSCAYLTILIYNDDVHIPIKSLFSNVPIDRIDESAIQVENSIVVYSSDESNLNKFENIENLEKEELLILTWTLYNDNTRIWFEKSHEGM